MGEKAPLSCGKRNGAAACAAGRVMKITRIGEKDDGRKRRSDAMDIVVAGGMG
jgi:hypothetical protein